MHDGREIGIGTRPRCDLLNDRNNSRGGAGESSDSRIGRIGHIAKWLVKQDRTHVGDQMGGLVVSFDTKYEFGTLTIKSISSLPLGPGRHGLL
jgi:hypothetical protein